MTVGDGFEITDDTNIINGCYTIVSSGTGSIPVIFDGVATSNGGCGSGGCSDYCGTEEFCVNISLSAFTGYNGSYAFVGSYNANTYYSGITNNGYIFYDGIKWCLSETLGGECDFFGQNPTESTVPDLDETILYNGVCVPTPTPYDPCWAGFGKGPQMRREQVGLLQKTHKKHIATLGATYRSLVEPPATYLTALCTIC
jgi:hypothetical protein